MGGRPAITISDARALRQLKSILKVHGSIPSLPVLAFMYPLFVTKLALTSTESNQLCGKWGCEECSVKCGAWRVQCEVWSVKCGVWRKTMRSVKCGLRSVKCEVWSVECEESSEKCEVWSVECGVLRVQCEAKCGVRRVQCEVWSVECEVCSVECEDCSEKCEVRSGASNVTCETRHQFRRVQARTGLAGARLMQVL